MKIWKIKIGHKPIAGLFLEIGRREGEGGIIIVDAYKILNKNRYVEIRKAALQKNFKLLYNFNPGIK